MKMNRKIESELDRMAENAERAIKEHNYYNAGRWFGNCASLLSEREGQQKEESQYWQKAAQAYTHDASQSKELFYCLQRCIALKHYNPNDWARAAKRFEDCEPKLLRANFWQKYATYSGDSEHWQKAATAYELAGELRSAAYCSAHVSKCALSHSPKNSETIVETYKGADDNLTIAGYIPQPSELPYPDKGEQPFNSAQASWSPWNSRVEAAIQESLRRSFRPKTLT